MVSKLRGPEMGKDSRLVFTLKATGNNKRASMRDKQDAVWTIDKSKGGVDVDKSGPTIPGRSWGSLETE